jgi:chaperonin GroEL (HSP60 family)
MAHKRILFHSPAREKILRGTAALADAVRVTLGPKSKSVLIQKSWGPPTVCNDGVTNAAHNNSAIGELVAKERQQKLIAKNWR